MEKLSNPQRTIEVIKKYEFCFQKKFGQNFLIDGHVLDKIIAGAGVTKDDMVLEIGPGIGTMTQYLAEAAGKVVAVEIDRNLLPILQETLADYDNVKVIHADVLSLDLEKLVQEENGGRPIKVVANLPYYITTPIILKLLSETTRIKTYTMMMQDEVANRICSKPDVKDYNALSVCIQYRALSSKVLNISRNIFVPKPNVDSAVIRLELFDTPPYKAKDEVFFFKLIRDAFCQRRKTLVNNLKQTGYDKTVVLDALTYLGLPEAIRSEALNVEEFVKLSDYLLPYHNNK